MDRIQRLEIEAASYVHRGWMTPEEAGLFVYGDQDSATRLVMIDQVISRLRRRQWWAGAIRKAVAAVVLGSVAGMLFGCATPPKSTTAQVATPTEPARAEKVGVEDGGFSAQTVPACAAANLRQRIPVADGSFLWCVEGEGEPSPRWEAVR